MSDLIKREDAVKTVIRKCSPICAWQVGTQQYPDCVVAEINALPSADDVQGELKYTITGQPYCSNCEYVFGEDEEFSPFWDYCPMCGARMKGGEDE